MRPLLAFAALVLSLGLAAPEAQAITFAEIKATTISYLELAMSRANDRDRKNLEPVLKALKKAEIGYGACTPRRLAYVSAFDLKRINVCPYLFEQTREFMYQTMFHEANHLAGAGECLAAQNEIYITRAVFGRVEITEHMLNCGLARY